MSVPSLRCKLRGDPYAVLGLDRNADDRKIRAAYYREARRWHPDKQQNPDKLAQSTAKFQQVQHAYEQILCSGRSDSAKATKQNCKAATPGAWPNSSSGNCHGSARAPPPEPRRPEPEPRPRTRSGRGAPLFAEGEGTPEERRWQEAEAQMQREAEEVMGRSAEYAEEVLQRRYQQQKASLQELLKQAQERKRREGESINEKLRDWNRKQKDAEGRAQEAPKESVPKGPEPDASESKNLAGRGPLSTSQNAEAPEATENSIPEPATGGPLPREVPDPSKAAGCEDGPADIPATPISRRRRSRRTDSQDSRRRRRHHKGQEAQKVAAGPLPRPHSVEVQQGPIGKDEAPAAAIVLEGLRYLLFRLLLLLRDRGRAKAQLGGAVRRLASQWSQLAEGLLRRSRGPLEEHARLARRECVLEQWASLSVALQGRARSQEHLRKSAQDRIKASLASPFSELSLRNAPIRTGSCLAN